MPQKNAIITVTIGNNQMYERCFLPTTRTYAEKIGADFHQIRELIIPTDFTSVGEMQRKHTICIQKMLIASLPWVQEYEWVLLVDADILFNAKNAPNIFDQVKDGYIWGVNEREQYGLEDYSREVWKMVPGENPQNAQSYYTKLKFDQTFDKQINGGFLVFQPKVQAEFFKSIYDTYMPRIARGEDVDGDQGPLNYEGWKAGKLACLDTRWNRIWLFTYALFYPFWDEKKDRDNLQKALKRCFELNYCVHMTGYNCWSLLV